MFDFNLHSLVAINKFAQRIVLFLYFPPTMWLFLDLQSLIASLISQFSIFFFFESTYMYLQLIIHITNLLSKHSLSYDIFQFFKFSTQCDLSPIHLGSRYNGLTNLVVVLSRILYDLYASLPHQLLFPPFFPLVDMPLCRNLSFQWRKTV